MTAPITTSPRHPWEELLAELTGRMRLIHGWGTEEDAKRSPVDRVTWVAGAAGFEPRRFNIAGQEVVQLLAVPHDVTLYGGSPAECFMRAKDLVGALDLLAGPPGGSAEATPPRPGYAVAAGKPEIRGGDAGAGAVVWALPLRVTLKDFVVRQFFPPHAVGSVSVSVTALNAPDDTPTGDSLNPVQVSG